MKIVLINHSDVRGGASVVSLRLVEALNAAGVEATMVVAHKESTSPLVVQGNQLKRRLAFIGEHLDIMAHNGWNRKTLFKISTGRFGMGLSDHRAVQEADIVILAWVNQGTLSFKEIEKLHRRGKKIVWIMHDRWNGTGVCHHVPEGCQRLSHGCGRCTLIGKDCDVDLSRNVFLKKVDLYNNVPITFVAVSHWLARECEAAGPMVNQQTIVIPNAFPSQNYSPIPEQGVGDLLPDGHRYIIMAAARLDDPIKNLPLAIASMNSLNRMDVTLVLVGDIRDISLLEKLKTPYIYIGPVDNPARIGRLMSQCDVVLSTSRFETLPTTVIEGMASGCIPVTTGHGGQHDIIDGAPAGFIADRDTPATIASLLSRALDTQPCRQALHEHIQDRFGAKAVTNQYISLFKKLLSHN